MATPSRRSLVFCLLLLLQSVAVIANVEKVIFTAPDALQIPRTRPTLSDLNLPFLSPIHSTLRTQLPREFPSASSPKGVSSWFLLTDLVEGQKYEVRICWAATQPTSFWFSTYELSEVFESPDLITSLAKYSDPENSSRQVEDNQPKVAHASWKPADSGNQLGSVLFLHVLAAADYFSPNRTLMEEVPPVLVDVILDPLILSVFPASQKLTALYLTSIAVGSWFLSKFIVKWLQMVARVDSEKKDR